MKLFDLIAEEVKKIKNNNINNNNLIDLAKSLNIYVSFKDLGSLKGFFVIIRDELHVVINNELPSNIQKIVLAHEIGHAVLHRKIAATMPVVDFNIFGSSNKLEYEANIFAAELLIDDNDLIKNLEETTTIYELAANLELPVELISLKLKNCEFKNRDLSISNCIRNDFLKDL